MRRDCQSMLTRYQVVDTRVLCACTSQQFSAEASPMTPGILSVAFVRDISCIPQIIPRGLNGLTRLLLSPATLLLRIGFSYEIRRKLACKRECLRLGAWKQTRRGAHFAREKQRLASRAWWLDLMNCWLRCKLKYWALRIDGGSRTQSAWHLIGFKVDLDSLIFGADLAARLGTRRCRLVLHLALTAAWKRPTIERLSHLCR